MEQSHNYGKYILVTSLIAAPVLFNTFNLSEYIPDEVLDWIVNNFVPNEEFFQSHFNNLYESFREKLPFQSQLEMIEEVTNVSGYHDGNFTVLDITYSVSGQPFQIALSNYIGPYLEMVRNFVTGWYVILLIYYNYRQIMFLIRGSNFNKSNVVD